MLNIDKVKFDEGRKMKCSKCGEKMDPGKNDQSYYYYCWNCGHILTVATIVYMSSN